MHVLRFFGSISIGLPLAQVHQPFAVPHCDGHHDLVTAAYKSAKVDLI